MESMPSEHKRDAYHALSALPLHEAMKILGQVLANRQATLPEPDAVSHAFVLLDLASVGALDIGDMASLASLHDDVTGVR